MEKQLFNEEGLQKLQEHLYGLENQELEREIFELEENFGEWVERHFELSASQQTFFAQMNEKMLRFLKQECGFAASNRLPVTLQKTTAAKRSEKDEEGDKLFEPKSKLQASTDAQGNFEASGNLVLQVTYG